MTYLKLQQAAQRLSCKKQESSTFPKHMNSPVTLLVLVLADVVLSKDFPNDCPFDIPGRCCFVHDFPLVYPSNIPDVALSKVFLSIVLMIFPALLCPIFSPRLSF